MFCQKGYSPSTHLQEYCFLQKSLEIEDTLSRIILVKLSTPIKDFLEQ